MSRSRRAVFPGVKSYSKVRLTAGRQMSAALPFNSLETPGWGFFGETGDSSALDPERKMFSLQDI